MFWTFCSVFSFCFTISSSLDSPSDSDSTVSIDPLFWLEFSSAMSFYKVSIPLPFSDYGYFFALSIIKGLISLAASAADRVELFFSAVATWDYLSSLIRSGLIIIGSFCSYFEEIEFFFSLILEFMLFKIKKVLYLERKNYINNLKRIVELI